MAKQIIPAGTSLKFIVVGTKKFVLTPLGDTIYTEPTTPKNSYSYTTNYSVEMEIEYDSTNIVKDSSVPVKVFAEYVGGRPNR
jgi:hypothetical protein